MFSGFFSSATCRAAGLWTEMFSQIVEPDFVLLAAPVPSNELAGRGAQRFLGLQDVRGRAHLIADHRVDLRIVAVELGKFRRDIAGRLDRAGAEVVLDRDEGGAGA